MRVVFRADAGPRIGGGHVMRCRTLAQELHRRGHEVAFVAADTDPAVSRLMAEAGIPLTLLASATLPKAGPEDPPHAAWRALPWEDDADATRTVLDGADWLVWDHYALDARWVTRATAGLGIRVLAIDDVDDRPLGSDIVLDQTAFRRPARRFPVPAALVGPRYALLRPEFAALRPAALARRDGRVRRVLVAPGMTDAAGLAPLALDALEAFPGLACDVAMGSASPTAGEVAERCAVREGWRFHPDAADMARLMVEADLCIGAGGMTSWERCCLGLPAITVPVAENQEPNVAILAEEGAIERLTLQAIRSGALRSALDVLVHSPTTMRSLSEASAGLIDGQGTGRVYAALSR